MGWGGEKHTVGMGGENPLDLQAFVLDDSKELVNGGGGGCAGDDVVLENRVNDSSLLAAVVDHKVLRSVRVWLVERKDPCLSVVSHSVSCCLVVLMRYAISLLSLRRCDVVAPMWLQWLGEQWGGFCGVFG